MERFKYMNKKVKIIISLMICVISLYVAPVKANTGDNPYQIYMPVVYHDTYVDPWIGPWGGKVVCMAANPNNPDEIYAGTWGNGVYKSYDGGLHWSSSNRGLGDGNINSIAIDPQNPKIVYAGTYNDELYKTTNGGESWYKSSQGVRDGDIIYTIGIDPHNPDIIFIGTRNKFHNEPPWFGVVYRSVNEGINWTPVLTNVGGSSVQDWPYDVIVNPKDHRMVFAAFHEYGVYRSWDSGDHWEAVNGNGLTELSGRALVINPLNSSGNLLVLGTWHRDGTFKSTDNGNTWVNHPLDVKVYTMDLDPQQPNNLYLVDYYSGVYKSTNAGDSWFYSGLGGNTMYTVMVNPARHNQIFAGTAGNGIFRSEDYGSHWVASSDGLINTDVVGFAVVPGETGHYLAATALGGIFSTLDGGLTWQEVSGVLEGVRLTDLFLNPLEPDELVVLSADQGVYTCLLPECHWRKANSGLPLFQPGEKAFQNFTPRDELETELVLFDKTFFETRPLAGDILPLNQIISSEVNQQMLYLATNGNGVYRSTKDMEVWVSAGLAGKNVSSIAVSPENDAVIYAADGESAIVYSSSNRGESWTESKLPVNTVYDLMTTPQTPGMVYAATDNGVYKQLVGEEWVSLGLDHVLITTLAAHPTQGSLLIAAGPNGVYYSKNGGVDWIHGPEELLSTNIQSIYFDTADPTIAFLTTNTKGIYRLKIK